MGDGTGLLVSLFFLFIKRSLDTFPFQIVPKPVLLITCRERRFSPRPLSLLILLILMPLGTLSPWQPRGQIQNWMNFKICRPFSLDQFLEPFFPQPGFCFLFYFDLGPIVPNFQIFVFVYPFSFPLPCAHHTFAFSTKAIAFPNPLPHCNLFVHGSWVLDPSWTP